MSGRFVLEVLKILPSLVQINRITPLLLALLEHPPIYSPFDWCVLERRIV